jgi:hypothetical protein
MEFIVESYILDRQFGDKTIRRHDTQLNNIQHNDTQHKYIHHNN